MRGARVTARPRRGMSIRNRFAVAAGTVCALALLASGALSYAIHSRVHYDDVDRVLVSDAAHAAEARTVLHAPDGGSMAGLRVAVRLYDASGRLTDASPDAGGLPLIDPRDALANPVGPVYDALAALVPDPSGPPPRPEAGAFGVYRAGGERYRRFVVPTGAGGREAFVETIAPLGIVDTSVGRLRDLLVALGTLSLTGAVVVSRVVAASVLRPVDEMTRAADAIARSGDLERRVMAPASQDELTRLALTFNGMLDSLSATVDAQRRFVADASHELRAPLTLVQGNLEFLVRHPEAPPDERAEVLTEAERESRRMARLIAELLTLARIDAGVPIRRDRVDLDAVLREAVVETRPAPRGPRVRLGRVLPVAVTGDADRLKQLLLILLDNAVKYTPEGGDVHAALAVDAGWAVLEVRDTGVGIPEADVDRVFDRFYRADPARGRDPGGSGLGLAIAKWIVDSHGGRVTLRSRVGAGTTVTVRLPARP